MDCEDLAVLLAKGESLYFDETTVANSSGADFDARADEYLLRRVQEQGVDLAGIATERLLLNWRLLVSINGNIRPSLAGLLFLARSPQQFIPYAYVSALRIPGDEIAAEPLDQKRFEGSLPEMLEDSMRFLEIHLLRPHHIKRLEPEVHPELPAAALREALVNAMAHRDYTVAGPIRLLVFDDRVEIRTPGRLPNTGPLMRSGKASMSYAIRIFTISFSSSAWSRTREAASRG